MSNLGRNARLGDQLIDQITQSSKSNYSHWRLSTNCNIKALHRELPLDANALGCKDQMTDVETG